MSSSTRKREGQRAAREFRKLSPAEQLEIAIKGGLVASPFPWKLGAGVEYLCVAFIGDDLAGAPTALAEALPQECAVVEAPATVAVFKSGSRAHELFTQAMGAA